MELDNFIKVLEHYDVDYKDFGDTYRAKCPIHSGGNNPTSFALKKDNALWMCHACGNGGDVISFIEAIENVGFKDALSILSSILGETLEDLQINKRKGYLKKNAEQYIKLIEFINSELAEITLPKGSYYPINSYRGFSGSTLELFGVRFFKRGTSGDTPFFLDERIMFPIYQEGKLVGASFRATKDGGPKWVHYPKGIKTAQMLYNIDNVEPFKPIVIVEGILDAMKVQTVLDVNVVCVFSANISKKQESLLLQYTDSLILCFDNDKAGRNATSNAIKDLRYKFNLSVIDLEDGCDPVDTSDEDLVKAFQNRRKIT